MVLYYLETTFIGEGRGCNTDVGRVPVVPIISINFFLKSMLRGACIRNQENDLLHMNRIGQNLTHLRLYMHKHRMYSRFCG
jgi:hypothetical protein